MLFKNKKKIKAIFFGTHNFASAILNGLMTEKSNVEIIAVVTAPDMPAGRKKELKEPPVKELIKLQNKKFKTNIAILQPETLKNLDIEDELKKINSDIFLVAEYGYLIPEKIFSIPQFKTVNVHPSMLPKFRDSSPLQYAILNGLTETGVSLIIIDKQMDHGPIVCQEKMPLPKYFTLEDAKKSAAGVAVDLINKYLPKLIDGTLKPVPQNDSDATFTKLIKKEDGKIDWNKSAKNIYNMYRAFYPWPGIFTMLENKRLKLLKVEIPEPKKELTTTGNPGKILIKNDRFFVQTSDGLLEILELQMEGKNALKSEDFIKGAKGIDNKNLG